MWASSVRRKRQAAIDPEVGKKQPAVTQGQGNAARKEGPQTDLTDLTDLMGARSTNASPHGRPWHLSRLGS